jgi:hypothetical protein
VAVQLRVRHPEPIGPRGRGSGQVAPITARNDVIAVAFALSVAIGRAETSQPGLRVSRIQAVAIPPSFRGTETIALAFAVPRSVRGAETVAFAFALTGFVPGTEAVAFAFFRSVCGTEAVAFAVPRSVRGTEAVSGAVCVSITEAVSGRSSFAVTGADRIPFSIADTTALCRPIAGVFSGRRRSPASAGSFTFPRPTSGAGA